MSALSSHLHSPVMLKQIPEILSFHLQIFQVYLQTIRIFCWTQAPYFNHPTPNIPLISSNIEMHFLPQHNHSCNWVIFLSIALGIFSLERKFYFLIKIANKQTPLGTDHHWDEISKTKLGTVPRGECGHWQAAGPSQDSFGWVNRFVHVSTSSPTLANVVWVTPIHLIR